MKYISIVISVLILLIGCGLENVIAKEQGNQKTQWPMFQRNTERTGARITTSVDNPTILWKTHIGIQGYLNNPIISGNHVFVTSSGNVHNIPDNLDGVYCLDSKTGTIVWHHQTNNDANGIAYSDEMVFVTGDDGFLSAYHAQTGAKVWSLKRNGTIYCQPLVVDNLVIIGDKDGHVIAVRKQTGSIAWSYKAASSAVRSAIASDGAYLYAAFVEGKVSCLGLAGNLIWEENLIIPGQQGPRPVEIYAAPTIIDDLLIIPYARDTTYGFPAVYCLNKINGSVMWTATDYNIINQSHGNIRSSVSRWNEYILYGSPYSDELIAIDFRNGNVAWNLHTGECLFPHWPSCAIAGDTLYFPRHDGSLYGIDLFTMEIKWEVFLGDHSMNKVVSKNIVTEPKDLRCSWEPSIGQPIYASPALDRNGTIYLGTGEGYIYAIGNGS